MKPKLALEMLAHETSTVAREYVDEQLLDRDPTNLRGFFLRGTQTSRAGASPTHAIQDYERALADANSDPELSSEVILRILSLTKFESANPH